MGRTTRICLLGIVAPLACDSDPRVPTVAVRDSAGIEIVDNLGMVWQPGEEWRLPAEPALEIGSVMGDPDYEFGSAHGPVRLHDGRIVVADMQADIMRFYDAEGRFLMSAGGSGEGPGEFTQLYRLRKISDDSLMALNPTSLTSIFTSAGEYVRRFQLDFVPGRGNLWWLGRLNDNTLVAFSLQREGTVELRVPSEPAPAGTEYARFDVPDRSPIYRDTLLYLLFDMEGALIDSFAKLPGQFMGSNRVLAPNAAYAFHEDAFFHSPGNVVEIRTFRSLVGRSQTGAPEVPREVMHLERIVRRVPPRDLAVTEAMKDAYVESQRVLYTRLVERTGRSLAEAKQLLRMTLQFPERIPEHGNRMWADALGNLWLQEYAFDPAEATRWSVFDVEGRWLGIVDMPAGFTVNEIGADYVLGIARDSLDVQYVRMYRLEKPRA
jgi:hypothetical protein